MEEIIFIYNADSGIVNSILDSAHKIISPNTYACSLCDLTHGLFGAKKEWKNFLKEVDMHVVFYHKDDRPEYLSKQTVPVILWKKDAQMSTLITSKELRDISSLKMLIINLKNKIYNHV